MAWMPSGKKPCSSARFAAPSEIPTERCIVKYTMMATITTLAR